MRKSRKEGQEREEAVHESSGRGRVASLRLLSRMSKRQQVGQLQRKVVHIAISLLLQTIKVSTLCYTSLRHVCCNTRLRT